MHFGVVSLFPEMFEALVAHGVTGRAVQRELATVDLINPRSFAADRHGTVDDRPYGGGPGMVMAVEPLCTAIAAARAAIAVRTQERALTVLMSPQGRKLDQNLVEELSQHQALVLIAGRYEGIDERLIEAEVDLECSIGDYVVSGGELPAMVLMDALVRRLPEALGHSDSAEEDSFAHGLLDCPHYTRPEQWQGRKVPEVLLSGDHGAIRQWRLAKALLRTWTRRPDLLRRRSLSDEEVQVLSQQVAAEPKTRN